MKDYLIGVGLLLSASTQLRVSGLAIGPGELSLVAGLGLIVLLEIPFFRGSLPQEFQKYVWFWLIFGVSLLVGSLTAAALGDLNDPSRVRHDLMAYMLMAALTLLLTLRPSRTIRIGWLMVCLGIPWLAFQLLHAAGAFSFGEVEPWFWHRLRGWSLNPNQLAVVAAALGIIALHFALAVEDLSARLVALICLALSSVTGALTGSDGFLLIIAATALVLAIFKLHDVFYSTSIRQRATKGLIFTTLLALPLIAATMTPYTLSLAASSQSRQATEMKSVKRMEDDAALRLSTWIAAVDRGVETYFLGLGPGPHLEIPTSLKMRLRESSTPGIDPQISSVPNFEAHNTVLDLFTQGGLLAVLSFSWILASTLLATLLARQPALIALLLSLLTFSLFHFIARQPMFWFSIVFCLVTARMVINTHLCYRRA